MAAAAPRVSKRRREPDAAFKKRIGAYNVFPPDYYAGGKKGAIVAADLEAEFKTEEGRRAHDERMRILAREDDRLADDIYHGLSSSERAHIDRVTNNKTRTDYILENYAMGRKTRRRNKRKASTRTRRHKRRTRSKSRGRTHRRRKSRRHH